MLYRNSIASWKATLGAVWRRSAEQYRKDDAGLPITPMCIKPTPISLSLSLSLYIYIYIYVYPPIHYVSYKLIIHPENVLRGSDLCYEWYFI